MNNFGVTVKGKEVISKMRAGKLLFYNKNYLGWFLDEESINKSVIKGLRRKNFIKKVVDIADFSRWELTKVGELVDVN